MAEHDGECDVDVAELEVRLTRAFLGLAAPAEEAAVAARVCLQAELLGRTSHGIRLAGNIAREYAAGAERRGPVQMLRETAVSVVVDGGFHLSPFVHNLAARRARRKARESGIAIVGVKNAGVSGALAVHAETIGERDLIALALNSSPAVVVAPGTASAQLGSNPLAIAVPRQDSPPIVLDMATSAIAFNRLLLALETDAPLPPGVAVDGTGAPTTAASDALDTDGRARLLPFGGHRGYGLALMIELLTAAALTDEVAPSKLRGPLIDPSRFPGLYIAIRPDLLDEPGRLPSRSAALAAHLVSIGARLPGEFSAQRRRAALARGRITVSAAHLGALTNLHG